VNNKQPKQIILYAEDDLDDFESVKEALDQLSDQHVLINARNGHEAMIYLEEHRDHLPGLVIIDLNMPVMDGKELLHQIKKREEFNKIPLIVFTTSSREEDIKLCQQLNCTFFRKPTLYRDLLHIVQTMLQKCTSPANS